MDLFDPVTDPTRNLLSKDGIVLYYGTSKHAFPWTKELFKLKTLVEEASEESFNSCLLNLYHDDSEGMGRHNDDEKEPQNHNAIGSMSLGADRK